ncbi:uncharacterized protein LOC127136206 [Lathyrus oleraceus]|uniref:uncharacterized protein LOC127136206 n=1 Tax=Pisum sativum TaxID=3888 RepID=UPI0021CF4173|nr:uncharacterized protein LOC127136206 [Pisum sativum]
MGHGVGVVLMNPNGGYTPFTARLCFEYTNNIAEYEACTLGIEAAIETRIKILEVYGDSSLVIYQVKGEWETCDEKLIPYCAHIVELIKYFDEITFHHVPRAENQRANAFDMLASMFQVIFINEPPLITIERKTVSSYCLLVEEETDEKPWFYDIKSYLQNQENPVNATYLDKNTMGRLVSKFFHSNKVLYKRNYDVVLLRCMDRHETYLLIKEIHEGWFGIHANGHAKSRKILRVGYYWLTMESNCFNYARKCHKCQIYVDKVHVPLTLLNVLSSPWPFSTWAIDMIGEIKPKASNGHCFILVAIDYFTKWVKAASYANVTKQVVAHFIKNHIICRYGVPSRIITDNGTNLKNKTMKRVV